MGGVCIALYGFIAVSGLKMIQKVDLNENNNLFVVSTILVTGVGGMALSFGQITITSIACALILGILVNALVNIGRKPAQTASAEPETAQTEELLQEAPDREEAAAAEEQQAGTDQSEEA